MARVARPTSLKVGPFTYVIKWMADEDWIKDKHNDNWGGESDHEQHTIYMRLIEGRSEQGLKETLLHEIMHCVWTVVGINHYPKPPDEDELDEYIITSTTPTLLGALRENPMALKYILST